MLKLVTRECVINPSSINLSNIKFDPVKHYLGKLCKYGHDWNNTGKSLRYKSKDCVICQSVKVAKQCEKTRIAKITDGTILVATDLPGEEWRDIPGLEGYYQASSLGRIKSIDRVELNSTSKQRIRRGRLLRTYTDYRGYLQTCLRQNGKQRTVTVHSLIAKTFLELPPGKIGSRKGEYTVNHKNGIKTDNHFSNLEWLTIEDNNKHAAENALKRWGSRVNTSKLSAEQVIEIRKLCQDGCLVRKIASQFNVSPSTINRIRQGKYWKHLKD